MEKLADICIVGAGVAGASLAAYLGRHGKRVLVIEKNMAERDVIIGELLQPGGVEMLHAMGLEQALQGIDAQPVEGYALFMQGGHFTIPYPAGKSGKGFRNGKFLQQLRKQMLQQASVQVIEGAATRLLQQNNQVVGVAYQTKTSEEEQLIHAPLTIVSDGMFSAFRAELSGNEKKVSSYFLGLLLKDCDLPYSRYGHVVVAEPSPCLLYPISPTETRMLIDFPCAEAPRKSAALTAYLEETIAPQLPELVLPAFRKAVEEGKFKVMPNHWIPARPVTTPGAVLLGDSLNMRHPLTGGGMTVALTDVKNLGDRLLSLNDLHNTTELTQTIGAFYATRHEQNATINILADALYGVMGNEGLKKACFNYLQRGGQYAEEPIRILSAISRDVNLLLSHFFAVALYGVKQAFRQQPLHKAWQQSHDLMRNAVHLVAPLVLNEKPKWLVRQALRAGLLVFR